MKKLLAISLLASIASFTVPANEVHSSLDYAQVKHVDAQQSKDGTWCFDTQILHNDQGWGHYADAWQIKDVKGNVLGERVLAHPHDNEQPFTRKLCHVKIPDGTTNIIVSAKCNEHGFGGHTINLDMGVSKGINFTIQRRSL